MKIENLIEDIIKDTTDIKTRLETRIRTDDPTLIFTILLPRLAQLSPVKTIEISIMSEGKLFILTAEIHTHNGNRVFETNSSTPVCSGEDKSRQYLNRYWFISLLREIIKKKTSKRPVKYTAPFESF